MIRKKYSFSEAELRAAGKSVLVSTGSLIINHEEEALESEDGIFERLTAWDAETVLRFRAFLSRNGAVLAVFEEALGHIRDRKRRRFEAVTAALASFAEFYEKQLRSTGEMFNPTGIFARWESSLVP